MSDILCADTFFTFQSASFKLTRNKNQMGLQSNITSGTPALLQSVMLREHVILKVTFERSAGMLCFKYVFFPCSVASREKVTINFFSNYHVLFYAAFVYLSIFLSFYFKTRSQYANTKTQYFRTFRSINTNETTEICITTCFPLGFYLLNINEML